MLSKIVLRSIANIFKDIQINKKHRNIEIDHQIEILNNGKIDILYIIYFWIHFNLHFFIFFILLC